MIKLSPVVRLSIGLTMLTVSLLLLSDMLGLMPNKQRSEIQTRKVLTELLAVQVSDSIEKGTPQAVKQQFDKVNDRYEEIASLGLRLQDSSLLYISGEHISNWQSFHDEHSTSKFVKVPIYRDGRKWADLEVAFSTSASTLLGFLTSQKTAAIVLLVGFFGFFINWLFLRRALSELDPSSVIPERVSAAFNVLAEGVVMLDRGGRIVLCNTAFMQKTNFDDDQLIGLYLSELSWVKNTVNNVHSGQFPWETLLETGITGPSNQIKLQTASGETLLFAVNATTISTPDGVTRGAVVTFDDVTELAKQHSELERLVTELKYSQREISRKNRELEILATCDPLTGSLNRRSLFERMESLQSDSRESGRVLSCIMVDIDHFKSINDNYGHAVGDDVIIMLSKIMNDVADTDCLVGRYGGEEFVVALPGYSEESAAVVAEDMRKTLLEGSYYLKNMPPKITASFGVSSDCEGLLSPGELVDLADKGLYVAKESGRNQVVRYSMRESHTTTTAEKPQNLITESCTIIDQENAKDAALDIVGQSANVLPQSSNQDTTASASNDDEDIETAGNMSVVTDRIEQSIRRSSREKTHAAVVQVELEVPSHISEHESSEHAGHYFDGITNRLQKVLRATDTVLIDCLNEENTGNEQSKRKLNLVVVLPDVADTLSAIWIVHRIREHLKIHLIDDKFEVLVKTNIGVSVYPSDGKDPTQLLTNSNQALLKSKESDDRIAYYFNREMNELADKTHKMEKELRLALQRDEFSLVYQPMIQLDTGKVVGFEVLIRWKNAIFGMVSPAKFIPIAEHIGVMDSIGQWIFEKAAFQLKRWQNAGFTDLYLSINVSASQFRTPEFLNHVRSTMDDAQLSHSNITVEITEKSLVNDLEHTAHIIDQLHETGFKVALDDFGIGYSSLVYLKNYSFDTVKIDRSFFAEFPSNARDTSLVRAIISLSKSLGLSVVAEGVETLIQVDVLKKLYCDGVQGYVFSEPLSGEQASSLLKKPDAITKKVVALSSDHNSQIAKQKHSAISGVLNEIGPLDISSLSKAANRARKIRNVASR